MSDSGKSVIRVGRPQGGNDALSKLVLAWARDAQTGEPRYILELGPERRGARCGCECPSCGLPLTAVNAAKNEFIRRPHFRHPEGAEGSECQVLAARVAALRQLQEDGWLDLPRRRRAGRVAGLSGGFHEAWVEAPAERLHIRRVDFRDRTGAILTFDDGRQLRVELMGEWGSGADPSGDAGSSAPVVPTIWLNVDDPRLAAMDPAELRKRLTLMPDVLCWQAHWADADLQTSADAAARERAQFYFDALPDGLELPADMDPALKRETVLHHEVKRLLEESRRLRVPELRVEVKLPSDEGVLRDTWSLQACELELAELALERRFGRIVPDVSCQAWQAGGDPALAGPLFIEVTVTNVIGPERVERIRQAGQPTLEIDLSLAGGKVTRDGLRRLVIDELAIKRWLFHPEAERQRAALLSELARQVVEEQAAAEATVLAAEARRQQALAKPLDEVARAYLAAVADLVDVEATETQDGRRPAEAEAVVLEARVRVDQTAAELGFHGFPEAADEKLFSHHGVLARLLSIQLARPVGYRLENLMGVLNAIELSKGGRRADLTLYLIALKVYKPPLSDKQQDWCSGWARRVRSSIEAGEPDHLRDPAYDRLLSVLFPEMAAGLSKPFGKRQASSSAPTGAHRSEFKRKGLPERGSAAALERQPQWDAVSARLLDTKPWDHWLKGRDLDAWKKANPESAKAWFESEAGDSAAGS